MTIEPGEKPTRMLTWNITAFLSQDVAHGFPQPRCGRLLLAPVATTTSSYISLRLARLRFWTATASLKSMSGTCARTLSNASCKNQRSRNPRLTSAEMCRSHDDRFPLPLWETWFCSSLGVSILALIANPQQCSGRQFRFDPYGDYLQTCQHQSAALPTHEWLVYRLSLMLRSVLSPG